MVFRGKESEDVEGSSEKKKRDKWVRLAEAITVS